MYLKSARVQHYKSLEDTLIEFANPITVLVGPNAVGKSNVVDCLRFVRDAVATNLENAISSRGGMGRVRQHSKNHLFKVGMKLEFVQTLRGDPLNLLTVIERPASYEFSIDSQGTNGYRIGSEEINCAYLESQLHLPRDLKYSRDRDGAIHGRDGDYKGFKDDLAFEYLTSAPHARPLRENIKSWHYTEIHPSLLRIPSTPDHNKELAEDGHNWASIIKSLKKTKAGKQSLEQIFEAMQVILPGFQDVTVSTVGSYLVPRFRFETSAQDTVQFDAAQLSDGTLRVFGMLLALYQSPAPSLLLIEEPEQGVHPGVLAVLVDAFKEASERTQIILTTHSPHLVDYFDPEQVRVVSMEAGVTQVSSIKATQMEAVKRRLMSMQDFMLAEGLLPQRP